MPQEDDAAHKSKWLSITEACDYLEISEQTMFRWMRENKITYYKVGKSTRFKSEDLDKAIEKVASKIITPEDINHCIVCGSEELISGTLSALGEVIFKPTKTRFTIWKDTSVKVDAICCNNCGYMHLKADLSTLNKK